MGEGREVPARAEGAPGGHDGIHAVVQHPEEELDDLRPDPGVPFREGVRADQHGRTDLVVLQWRTRTRGVAPDEILLEAEGDPFEMETFSSWPNPVVTPYAGRPLFTISSSAPRDASMRRRAAWPSFTDSPPRATRTTSSAVSDSPSIVSRGRPPAGEAANAIKALRGTATWRRGAEKVHTDAPDSACVQIVFLGTSGSWPTPKRNVSAIAVKRGPETLLFDCGEGTQRQFMLSSLSFMQVTRVFLTHFHGDHFLGLPGLIQSMSMNGREKELLAFGPPGTEELVDALVNIGHFTSSFPVAAKGLKGGDEVDCGEY